MFRRRIFQILLLLALLPVGWRLAVLAGSAGEPLRREAAQLSLHTGELAAIRGCIYDGSGTLLAWSERHYDLYWNGETLPEALTARLRELLPGWNGESRMDAERGARLLQRGLTLPETESVDSLAVRYPALETVLRWERHTVADAGLRKLIGEVMTVDGLERGISGWEEEFEEQLCGVNGRYTVLLDRHGRWIDRTFRQSEAPEAGTDVHLALSIAELRKLAAEPADGEEQ